MSTSFAKASVSENASGELVADLSCLNGNPNSSQYVLPGGAAYYNQSNISVADEILFIIRNDSEVDAGFIFPYNESTGSPLSIGGGIGKGNIIEDFDSTTGGTGGTGTGSGNPTDAAVSVQWVNGMNADGVISEVADEAALSMEIGTEVYFLMTYNANGVEEVNTVTLCESTCGDVPAGAPQFTFGETSLAQGN